MTLAALPLAVVAAASVVTTALRWGAWRWLGLAAALPGAVVVLSTPPAEGVAIVALGLGLLCCCWHWPAGTSRTVLGALAILAAVGITWAVGPAAPSGTLSTTAWLALLFCLALGLAGAAGLARSHLLPLRIACLLTVAAPTVLLVSSNGAAGAVAWWPASAALGLTGLLRGARGGGTKRGQADEADLAASTEFDTRYDRPVLAPVVVVIAAFDEEAGIGPVLAGMPSAVCGLSVDTLVVDDGSSDATADVAADSGRAYVVRCPSNRGQGAALRLGYRIAREHGADYLITTDADGQYDVVDMPIALRPIIEGEADFVTGSRRRGHQPVQDPLRRLGVVVFAWLVGMLTGHRLTDTSFGLRAMRADITADVTLNQPQYQSSELLIGILSHGHRVLEVPATMHPRGSGASKKGGNWVYGRRYAGVVLGTWWREGCPAPVTSCPAVRPSTHHGRGHRQPRRLDVDENA